MATLTVNVTSPASLSISGTTQKSTTISWSLPSVPSGATISSCTLTGTATASMSKGSATITVSGQTVYSGSQFTINLGTGNTTNSVTATAKGGNKNARGTVTFSNLVYTVNYSIALPKYTITFVDWDGTVLKTQEVEEGSSATAPTNPTRTGYAFTGWDVSFSNVTSNLTITAQYEKLYTVTFVDYDGTVLKTEEVRNGGSATAPEVNRVGYEFIGWSVDFSNVISNITTVAQYIKLQIFKVKENNTWDNIKTVYKKVSGNWVEQTNNTWGNIFNQNFGYIRKEIPIEPTAILYSDGTFIFSNYNIIDKSHGDVVKRYTGWDKEDYGSHSAVPWYNECNDIIVVYLKDACPNSMSYWFNRCNNLTSLDVSNFDTSNVTSIRIMFGYCSSLTSLDLSNFDTSNVTDMGSMFYMCTGLTSLDLSNFDTGNVTDMNQMFCGCSGLTSLDVSHFDTSKVTNMSAMFDGFKSLTSLDLSNFDTSNVTSMGNMFKGSNSLTSLDLSNFNTSKVTTMGYMFHGCSGLTSLDLSNFDTSKVTNMSYMFNGCSGLTSLDLSNFDTSNVTKTNYMFDSCTNPDLKIYVKDETMADWVKATTNFPSTATVVVGSPN